MHSNILLEMAIALALKIDDLGARITVITISNLRSVDDISLLAAKNEG